MTCGILVSFLEELCLKLYFVLFILLLISFVSFVLNLIFTPDWVCRISSFLHSINLMHLLNRRWL